MLEPPAAPHPRRRSSRAARSRWRARASRPSRAIPWPSPPCSACRAAPPSAWCSDSCSGSARPAGRAGARRLRLRGRAGRGRRRLPDRVRRGRAARPRPAAGRGHRGHLLLLGHHGADLAGGRRTASAGSCTGCSATCPRSRRAALAVFAVVAAGRGSADRRPGAARSTCSPSARRPPCSSGSTPTG